MRLAWREVCYLCRIKLASLSHLSISNNTACDVDTARGALEKLRWSPTTGNAASASRTTPELEVIASVFRRINRLRRRRRCRLGESATSDVYRWLIEIRTNGKHTKNECYTLTFKCKSLTYCSESRWKGGTVSGEFSAAGQHISNFLRKIHGHCPLGWEMPE